MKEIEYRVSVGSASTDGTVFVHDNATDDEIRVAIMDRLYSVTYKIVDNGSYRSAEYVVDVGGGATYGEVIINDDADENAILLAICDRLYDVTYHDA
jgi:hypothetical protein